MRERRMRLGDTSELFYGHCMANGDNMLRISAASEGKYYYLFLQKDTRWWSTWYQWRLVECQQGPEISSKCITHSLESTPFKEFFEAATDGKAAVEIEERADPEEEDLLEVVIMYLTVNSKQYRFTFDQEICSINRI